MLRVLAGLIAGYVLTQHLQARRSSRLARTGPYRAHLRATTVQLSVDDQPGHLVEGYLILLLDGGLWIPVLLPLEGPRDAFLHTLQRVVWKASQQRAVVSADPIPHLLIPDVSALRAQLRSGGRAEIVFPASSTDRPVVRRFFHIPNCHGAPGILQAVGFQEQEGPEACRNSPPDGLSSRA
ncbi:MAG: hypothetical protein HYY25_01080 [Candidatus Wallbacteria bacterium]|nr:hypothetical protein [Candidatus Wallbacteria bacterium]